MGKSQKVPKSAVNDRKYVFDFRPKPNIWPEKPRGDFATAQCF